MSRKSAAATALPSPTPAGRPSVNARAAAQNDGAPDDELSLRTRTAQRLAALLALVSSVELPDALRERYIALLSELDAINAGRKLRTDAVLADAAALSPSTVQASLERRLPGFGPTQMRYTLDLTARLQELDAGRRSGKVTYALTRAATVTRAEVLRAYRRLYVQLDELLAPADPERNALGEVLPEGQSHDALINALEALARVASALLDRAAKNDVLRLYCEDNGLTRATLTEILKPFTAEADAGAEGGADGDAIDVLEGRLADQLKRLRRVVEEARKVDPALAEVALPRTIRRNKPKKQGADAKKTATPAKDATPTPANDGADAKHDAAPAKPADHG